jgi:hypothetical protein
MQAIQMQLAENFTITGICVHPRLQQSSICKRRDRCVKMDTDLAQLVSSSIRDVLATVGADEAAPAGAEAPSTSAADLGNYTSVSAALSGAFSDR